MNDPRKNPVPDDFEERIEAFVKDLAYGARQEEWSPQFGVVTVMSGEKLWRDAKASILFTDFIKEKWQHKIPDLELLQSYGYILRVQERVSSYRWYVLTKKAFALLEQPSSQSIFISYCREESSAFVLSLLNGFKAVGLEPFLDIKDIKLGEKWHPYLESEIRQRKHFICLIGPKTLKSSFVCKEIEWAIEANSHIIPIWHNNFNPKKAIQDFPSYKYLVNLSESQAIILESENPKSYEGAIIELLNYFGYTPS